MFAVTERLRCGTTEGVERFGNDTNACLDELYGSRNLFKDPDQYEENSTTQQQQARRLQTQIRNAMMTWDRESDTVLDVECGTGNVTAQFHRNCFLTVASLASTRRRGRQRPDTGPKTLTSLQGTP